ncbi:phenylacetaldehyde reductase-like [Cryptomeria japonica]|uniref:phenylacetaldehyde reductase-like n=1 Tax=Cryptomeria japonica TaxID=3369 RepID=UPI0027DA9BFF|nr:phenylacetaldehyde reductase-like [Cryptomeria japonica]
MVAASEEGADRGRMAGVGELRWGSEGRRQQGPEGAGNECVTGAAGYIGSWLVKNLLERGYTVNATLRDPGDEKKSSPLLDLSGAEDRLKLFQADLLKEGSFDSAVEGCEGVFHVAGSYGPSNLTCK